jgi:cytochrome oxidase Cu insertion factor (SCO1/SenC/PrrC family)
MNYLKFLGVFIVVVSMYIVLVNNYNIIHKSKVYLIDGHYNMKSVG